MSSTPSARIDIHATEAEEAEHLVRRISAHYVDGHRPFVVVEVGDEVDFFLHIDSARSFAETILAAVDAIELPTELDALESAWRKDGTTLLGFAEWVAALESVRA